MKKIKVTKNGPYLVSGEISLYLKQIVEEEGLNVLKTIKKLDTPKTGFALCRCGKSVNPPFCDAAHKNIGFDGTEVAGHDKYKDRAEIYRGEDMDLLDDDRCAFARFCHKHLGDVWTLTQQSDNPEAKKQAIEAASQCPTGRLTAILNRQPVEPELEDSISIVEDLPKKVSAGIFVTGNIIIEDADGKKYEARNRQALCRCGASQLKPFCDASHVSVQYNDGIKRKSGKSIKK
ncbi:MAG: CDGSH iron-sulfur domain-containing protein [Endomicrobia bacterium]|nr:CDGSH iron-sulfur domain-containing protein [Endomicrobiia bacterium]MCL2506381.1 CDGSH iron-sulfur domain-containing protein [Endomicrobiia bacterium]